MLGWRLTPSWGGYGEYGWGFGWWKTKDFYRDVVHEYIIAQFGPYKASWERVRPRTPREPIGAARRSERG